MDEDALVVPAVGPDMRVGIIGAGEIGGTLAGLLVRLEHEVIVANSRGPETLTSLVTPLGPFARAGTVTEAAAGADLVVLAMPYFRYPELPPEPFAGKVVIDANNYVPARDGQIADLDRGEVTASERIARHLTGASVIKAFNTIYWTRLRDKGRPGLPMAERMAIPVAGDDVNGKDLVMALINELGFAPVDAGSLADGRRQEFGKPVFNAPVGPARALALLEQG